LLFLSAEQAEHHHAYRSPDRPAGVPVAMHQAVDGPYHRQTQTTLQTRCGERTEQRGLFGVTLAAGRVALVQHLPQERLVVVAAGEVPTAMQFQGPIHRGFGLTV
jgi:hypothetical protein